MEVLALVCSVALAVVAMVSGVPKVQLQGQPWTFLRDRGVSAKGSRAIGLTELTCVVLLMVGLFWRPAGVLAAAVLLGMFTWAVRFHFRHGDYENPDMRAPAFLTLGIAVGCLLTLAALLAAA